MAAKRFPKYFAVGSIGEAGDPTGVDPTISGDEPAPTGPRCRDGVESAMEKSRPVREDGHATIPGVGGRMWFHRPPGVQPYADRAETDEQAFHLIVMRCRKRQRGCRLSTQHGVQEVVADPAPSDPIPRDREVGTAPATVEPRTPILAVAADGTSRPEFHLVADARRYGTDIPKRSMVDVKVWRLAQSGRCGPILGKALATPTPPRRGPISERNALPGESNCSRSRIDGGAPFDQRCRILAGDLGQADGVAADRKPARGKPGT
jgi:hypothetical protein